MTTAESLRQQFPDAGNWQLLGDGLWRARTDSPFQHYRYVLVDDEHGVWASMLATAEPMPGLEAEVRRTLTAEIEHMLLPTCIVPGCQEKAPLMFKAAEYGRLAGRDWVPGQEIRVCPDHGQDIYRAQGARGVDELAEWLKPDARLDPLDEFDAEYDVLHGREIRERWARALMVKIPAQP